MIVKRNFSPTRVAAYVWRPGAFVVAVAMGATALREITDSAHVGVPYLPVGTLGAAVAIFVAFRINASYGRWTDARAQWASIQNASRVLVRQLVAATDNAVATGSATSGAAAAYTRTQARRLVAYANALRIELRGTGTWDDLGAWLEPDEFEAVAAAANTPSVVLQRVAIEIKSGVRDGLVGQFDPISLEPNLGALNAAAAACERLKNTPTPRQYDYFTRVGVFRVRPAAPARAARHAAARR